MKNEATVTANKKLTLKKTTVRQLHARTGIQAGVSISIGSHSFSIGPNSISIQAVDPHSVTRGVQGRPVSRTLWASRDTAGPVWMWLTPVGRWHRGRPKWLQHDRRLFRSA